MNDVKIVLCAGLIGSGKSTFLSVLKECGAETILADDLWKQFVYKEANRARLKDVLGEDVLDGNGNPLRPRLRALFFSLDVDEQIVCVERLKKLLGEFGDEFFSELKRQVASRAVCASTKVVIVEHSVALRDGWVDRLLPHYVVTLHCHRETRLARLLERDPQISEETYRAIMALQPSDEEHLYMADRAESFHVDTSGSKEASMALARRLYQTLIAG